jgi:hypothetical protein
MKRYQIFGIQRAATWDPCLGCSLRAQAPLGDFNRAPEGGSRDRQTVAIGVDVGTMKPATTRAALQSC